MSKSREKNQENIKKKTTEILFISIVLFGVRHRSTRGRIFKLLGVRRGRDLLALAPRRAIPLAGLMRTLVFLLLLWLIGQSTCSSPIKYIVVMMMENHSFDNTLGWLEGVGDLNGQEFNYEDPRNTSSTKYFEQIYFPEAVCFFFLMQSILPALFFLHFEEICQHILCGCLCRPSVHVG
jgi:hypothetical protein